MLTATETLDRTPVPSGALEVGLGEGEPVPDMPGWAQGGGTLFLDIDGVLDPFLTDSPEPPGLGWESFRDGGITRWFNVSFAHELLRLDGLGVDIVWATTWCSLPDGLEAYAEAMGLPHDKRLDGTLIGGATPSGCGKLKAVKKWWKSNSLPSKVAWLDDALGTEDYEFARRLGILALAPSPDLGLGTPGLLAQLSKLFG